MSLHVFADDEVEYGGEDAVAYEQPEDTATALGKILETSSFANGDEASSERAARNAATKLDAALQGFVRGQRLSEAQALLFPLAGAYAKDKRLLRVDVADERFLRAYRMTAEKIHAGTLASSGAGNIKRDKSPAGEIEYFAAGSFNAITADPDIWPLAAQVTPPL